MSGVKAAFTLVKAPISTPSGNETATASAKPSTTRTKETAEVAGERALEPQLRERRHHLGRRGQDRRRDDPLLGGAGRHEPSTATSSASTGSSPSSQACQAGSSSRMRRKPAWADGRRLRAARAPGRRPVRPSSLRFRRVDRDLHAPVERLVHRVVRVGRLVPALALDRELVRVEVVLLDAAPASPPRRGRSRAALTSSKRVPLPFIDESVWPDDGDDRALVLARRAAPPSRASRRRSGRRACSAIGLPQLVVLRLVDVRRVRVEVDADRLGQDRRLGRHLLVARAARSSRGSRPSGARSVPALSSVLERR